MMILITGMALFALPLLWMCLTSGGEK